MFHNSMLKVSKIDKFDLPLLGLLDSMTIRLTCVVQWTMDQCCTLQYCLLACRNCVRGLLQHAQLTDLVAKAIQRLDPGHEVPSCCRSKCLVGFAQVCQGRHERKRAKTCPFSQHWHMESLAKLRMASFREIVAMADSLPVLVPQNCDLQIMA